MKRLVITILFILLINPAVTACEELPPVPEPAGSGYPARRILIKQIEITGNTVLTRDDLSSVIGPYHEKKLSAEDLEALRRQITREYVKRGYVNSGAVIPPQDASGGVLSIRIVEGTLDGVRVTGTRWFRKKYIKDRILHGLNTPLHIGELREKLHFLKENRVIKRIDARLKPGIRPGESRLDIDIEEKPPFRFNMSFNNYISPSVGGEQGEFRVSHENLSGRGDSLRSVLGASSGIHPGFGIHYILPLTPRETSFEVNFSKNDFTVVEAPFRSIDVESESDVFGVALGHPFYRTLKTEFKVLLGIRYLKNRTYLLGEPFSFNRGAENGVSEITFLSLTKELVHRARAQVFAARSRFNLGVNAWNATIHEDENIPDGKFLSWLGQFQYGRNLGMLDAQVFFNFNVQLTDDPLLSPERFAVGGRYSVRGYRENTLVRDNGITSSLEVRIPLLKDHSLLSNLWFAPFIDYGCGWNRGWITHGPRHISSVGAGFRWEGKKSSSVGILPGFEIYWGIPLRDVSFSERDMQDNGIHFSFVFENG